MAKDFGSSQSWRSSEDDWNVSPNETDFDRQDSSWGDGPRNRTHTLPRLPIRAILMCVLILGFGLILWYFRFAISDFLIMVLQWVVILAIVVIILKLIFFRRRR